MIGEVKELPDLVAILNQKVEMLTQKLNDLAHEITDLRNRLSEYEHSKNSDHSSGHLQKMKIGQSGKVCEKKWVRTRSSKRA